MTKDELFAALRKYYYEKRGNAEEMASTYCWPIGKWDVSQVTNFSGVLIDMLKFNEDIGDWDVSNGTS